MDYNKIVSFSLWGTNLKYTLGAIKNVKIIKEIMPDGLCVFYIAKEVPELIKQKLIKMGAKIIEKESSIAGEPLFGRFEAVEDFPNCTVIVRDTDSRISQRELFAINEGLKSDKKFHIIRDHPNHYSKIMGGMGGSKPKFLCITKMMIEGFAIHKEQKLFYSDQNFLNDVIFPLVKDNALIHDEFRCDGIKINYPRNNFEYIGQPITARDEIERPEDTEILKQGYITHK